MSRIKILSDRVANQIAAGEVIERPAAVVKELVENALDAGATRVEVEFRQGGRSLIRVEDNGCGMDRADAELSLQRHATSKIAEAVDLDRLATFGFRGEALPSIASVSHFLLRTRRADAEAGTEILVDGGRPRHVRECGCPVGTRIEVSQLFNSVPARRKFLKSDRTEAAHIVQCVRLYALACPRVAFTLIEDGRLVFRSPEAASIGDRIAEIFGRQTAESLVPIEAGESGLRLGGLIGRPSAGRATRHEMITFVNARPVDSRTLNYALIESYHDSLPRGRYPLAFVFLELDPAAVDVNVHPAKREVRFRDEPAVRSFVIRTVLARLRDLGGATSVAVAPGDSPVATPAFPVLNPLAPAAVGAWTTGVEGIRRQDLGGLAVGRSGIGSVGGAAVPVAPALAAIPTPTMPAAQPTAAAAPGVARPLPWRFLGTVHGTTVIFESAAGLVLLDRRAAHERIWFERLRAQFRDHAVPSQRLLLPIPVEFDSISTAILLDWLGFLRTHGFEIGEFGRNFFRIEAVPGWMEPPDAEPFLRDVVGALRDGQLPHGNDELARDELARLAAAKAVRLPASTGEAECRDLADQLFATQAPLTTPSGRPTLIELNHQELARRFQR